MAYMPAKKQIINSAILYTLQALYKMKWMRGSDLEKLNTQLKIASRRRWNPLKIRPPPHPPRYSILEPTTLSQRIVCDNSVWHSSCVILDVLF